MMPSGLIIVFAKRKYMCVIGGDDKDRFFVPCFCRSIPNKPGNDLSV